MGQWLTPLEFLVWGAALPLVFVVLDIADERWTGLVIDQ